MVRNEYGIAMIRIESTAKCFCPLGQDWYTNQFEIYFEPDELIPDYCEMDRWIEENINQMHMIIEYAVAALHKYLTDTYKPKSCKVTSYVDDAKHSAVVVTKE